MYQQVIKKIKEYSSIVIFGHVSPDGDCYGSEMGLRQFLRDNFSDKKVYALGSGFKKAVPFLGALDNVDDEIIKDSLAIVVDVSDLERIEDQRLMLAKEIIKFDHHLLSDKKRFETINISNTSASSCAEMIGDFIIQSGYFLSPLAATYLYLGIVTDTGRFLYLNKDSLSFKVSAALLEAGVDISLIYHFLYESDEVAVRAKGYIGYFYQVKEHVAYIVLDKETLKKLNIDYNYASTMVNVLSNIKNIEAWVSFAESETNEVRVELRSKNIDVQQVAIFFNGGGHKNASGCKLENIIDYMKVVDKINEVINHV